MNQIHQQDLEAFFNLYEQAHICPYYFRGKPEVRQIITNCINKTPVENDLDFVYLFRYMLKRLIGQLDSHSMIRTRNEYERLPLQITSHNSLFTVTATGEQYTNFLNKVVTKINGINLEQLAKESENVISYSTDGYLELEASRFLSHYDPLRTLPSIDSETTQIVYTFSDGNELKVEIGEPGFIDQAKPANYQLDLDNGHLLLHYTACQEEYPNQMQEVVEQIRNLIPHHNVNLFTLDLRGNMGGDDRIIQPLVDCLKTQPLLKKQVFVDRAVQSAALFALNDMTKLGAKVFDTAIGSSLNHIGNNRRLELPSGRFLTIVATRYFYLDEQNNFVTIRTPEDFKNLDKKYITPKYIHLDGIIPH
jgi:hypothetical protein